MPEATIKEDYGKTLMSWQFPEFIKYERNKGWYLIAGIIGLALVIYALLTANFLFAIIIIIFAIITLIHARREPSRLTMNLTEDGIKIEDKFYPYKEIKNFWLIYEPPKVKTLYINFKGTFRSNLSISLEKQNPLKVRKILLNYIDEDLSKESESTSDQLSRWLKL